MSSPTSKETPAAGGVTKSHPASIIVSKAKRNSQFAPLTLPTLDFSLTKGTNIPSPPATPSPIEEEDENGRQTPTFGGGPLSSHPTTPVGIMPGSFPPGTPTSTELKANRVLGRDPNNDKPIPFDLHGHGKTNGFNEPGTVTTSVSGRRNSTSSKSRGMKRLFSFRSFYNNSNASSADCFSGNGPTYDPTKLGRTSTAESIQQPFRPSSSLASNRPESPFTTTSNATGNVSPGLRKKRSSAWFSSTGRRKSGLFMIGRVDETMGNDEQRLGTGVSEKENREPPPTIPEVKADTEIGGEELFKNIN